MNAEDATQSGAEDAADAQGATAKFVGDQDEHVQGHVEDNKVSRASEGAHENSINLDATQSPSSHTKVKSSDIPAPDLVENSPHDDSPKHDVPQSSKNQPVTDENISPGDKTTSVQSTRTRRLHRVLVSHVNPPPDNDRSSLEILQAQTRRHSNEDFNKAIASPLPVSKASSLSSGSLRTSASHAVPLGQSRERLELRPEDIPLPTRKPRKRKNTFLTWAGGTTASTSKKKEPAEHEQQKNVTPADTELKNYRKNINRLAEHFPNFHNVAATDTRHQWSSRIVIHDRVTAPEVQGSVRQEPFAGRIAAPAFSEFRKRLRGVTDDCVQRLILVEDLSPNVIDLLGATFDIAPHVFEEHLNQSGYKKLAEDDVKPGGWHTHFSSLGNSSVASVKWYRPVLPLIPISQRFRAKLTRGRRPQVYCPFDGCTRHTLPLAATANIWRHSLDLCPEPGVYHKGSPTEYPVGWEEVVTMWKRDIDGCEFGKYSAREWSAAIC